MKRNITKRLTKAKKQTIKYFKVKKHQRRAFVYVTALVLSILIGLYAHSLRQTERKAVEARRAFEAAQVLEQKEKAAVEARTQVEGQKQQLEQKLINEFVPKQKFDEEVKSRDQQIEQLKQSKANNVRLVSAKVTPKPVATQPPARRLGAGAYGPNTYGFHSCTWWSKAWRPDLPSSLGNANTWAVRARALGWTVVSTPAPGAVGVTTRGAYGHVVVVVSVNSNGTMVIKEGNWDYAGSVRQRAARWSEFPWYIL